MSARPSLRLPQFRPSSTIVHAVPRAPKVIHCLAGRQLEVKHSHGFFNLVMSLISTACSGQGRPSSSPQLLLPTRLVTVIAALYRRWIRIHTTIVNVSTGFTLICASGTCLTE